MYDSHLPIRLIVTDLDGTLLTDDKKISRENMEALAYAASRGVHIVPSTGRFYKALPEEIRNLPFVRYVSAMNGAQVYDAQEDSVLKEYLIPLETAEEVFSVLDTMPIIYDCYQHGWGWMERGFYERIDEYVTDPAMNRFVHSIRTPVDGFKSLIHERGEGVQKIQMYFHTTKERNRALSLLRERFPKLNSTYALSNNIEINSPLADKGRALGFLCEHLGIDISQTMAFGDNSNDLTMLKAAGIGVAMKNGSEEALNAADYITDTNNEHGVAKAIYTFCK